MPFLSRCWRWGFLCHSFCSVYFIYLVYDKYVTENSSQVPWFYHFTDAKIAATTNFCCKITVICLDKENMISLDF